MVLDIGNNAIDQIPLNVRFLAGFLQAVAVRAAGFGIVPLASLAPAVKSVSSLRNISSHMLKLYLFSEFYMP